MCLSYMLSIWWMVEHFYLSIRYVYGHWNLIFIYSLPGLNMVCFLFLTFFLKIFLLSLFIEISYIYSLSIFNIIIDIPIYL